MKILWSVALYTALALNSTAEAFDRDAVLALREGLLVKLALHEEPQPGSEVTFADPDGGEHSLADYEGKVVLLNFWATWCTPCLKEMPSLDRLQAELGGDDFAVVPVATSRNPLPAINRFFERAEIANLPILLDPDRSLAAEFGAFSLPLTVILNAEGQEIGRLTGDAEWDNEAALAILRAIIASGGVISG